MKTKKTLFSRFIATVVAVCTAIMCVPFTMSVDVSADDTQTYYIPAGYVIGENSTQDEANGIKVENGTITFGVDGVATYNLGEEYTYKKIYFNVASSILQQYSTITLKTKNKCTFIDNAKINGKNFIISVDTRTNICLDGFNAIIDTVNDSNMAVCFRLAEGSLTIKNSNINIQGDIANVISTNSADITVDNSTIGFTNIDNAIVTSSGNIKIINNSKITGSGNSGGIGIASLYGDVNISNPAIDLTGFESGGIIARSNIYVDSSRINITGSNIGIGSTGAGLSGPTVKNFEFRFKDSTINMENVTCGIMFAPSLYNGIGNEVDDPGIFFDNTTFNFVFGSNDNEQIIHSERKIEATNGSAINLTVKFPNDIGVYSNNGCIFLGYILGDDTIDFDLNASIILDNTSYIKITSEESFGQNYILYTCSEKAVDDIYVLAGSEYNATIDKCTNELALEKQGDIYNIFASDYKTVYFSKTTDFNSNDDEVYYEINSNSSTAKLSTTTATAGDTVYVSGVTGKYYKVCTKNGKVIASINGSGSFIMPDCEVVITEDLTNSGSIFAINKNVFCKSYVTEYDAQNNSIKKVASRTSGEIILDYGRTYANRTVTIYEGKGTSNEYMTVTLDAKGKATISVENGKNYTAVVTD